MWRCMIQNVRRSLAEYKLKSYKEVDTELRSQNLDSWVIMSSATSPQASAVPTSSLAIRSGQVHYNKKRS